MLILENHPLKGYSTFKIGGRARYLIEIKSDEDAASAIAFAQEKKLPWIVIGRGSNCLFPDAGYHGIVIVLVNSNFKELGEGRFEVGAGLSFAYLGIKTAKMGWTGLEFAAGIPGSVGGAIYMNAGANGKETAQSLEKVVWMRESGEIQTFLFSDLHFSYRKSPFQEMKGLILQAVFSLKKEEGAWDRQQLLLKKRIETQPYSTPSIGCFFKNPLGSQSAGYLIEQCGLKGKKIGGALVSDRHANFIVNEEGASAQDVMALKDLVKKTVFEQTGILLEEEVKII